MLENNIYTDRETRTIGHEEPQYLDSGPSRSG